MSKASDLLATAKSSLEFAARAATLAVVKPRPFKCKNGSPLVTCLAWNACKGACAGHQLCIPNPCNK